MMKYFSCNIILIISSLSSTVAFVPPFARRHRLTTESKITSLLSSYSKWDNLVDEEEEEYIRKNAFKLNIEIPWDMRYETRNMERQHKQFNDIRAAGGVEVTNDVYVRQPETDVYWFVGKIAMVDDITPTECVGRQYPLIAQHAAMLRPMELYLHRESLFEFYLAPGDSELEVAYNRPGIKFEKVVFEDDFSNVRPLIDIKVTLVGFQGEEYEKGEEGFRTWRTEDGYAKNPEVQSAGGEKVSPEEMSQLMSQTRAETTPEEVAELMKQMEKIDDLNQEKENEKE